jgi:cell division septal protein FtsQ
MNKIIGITIFSVLILALISVIFFSNLNEGKQKILSVEILGNKLLSNKDYMDFSGLYNLIGTDSLSLPLIREKFLKHPYIKDANVELTSNHKVVVHLEEKEIVASLLKDSNSFFVTNEFRLLPVLENTKINDYPVITNSTVTKIDFQSPVFNNDFKKAVKIIETAKLVSSDLYKNLSEINLRNGAEIVLYFSDMPQVFIGNDDLVLKLASLDALRKDNQKKDLLVNSDYVDLRYNENIFIGLHKEAGIN